MGGSRQLTSQVSVGTRLTIEPKIKEETSIVMDIGIVIVQEVSRAQGRDWEFS